MVYFNGQLVQDGVYTFKVSGTYNNGEKFTKLGAMIVIYSK